MNILVLSQYFYPENFRINEVAASLVKKGQAVDVLTGQPNYPEGKIFPGYLAWSMTSEAWKNAQVFRVPLFPRGVGKAWKLVANYLSFVLSGLVLGAWRLRGRRYDVIFVYAPSPILQAIPAVFLGWLKGCPVVLWVQDLWPESLSATGYVKSRRVLKLIEYVVGYIYRHVDLLLVQSEAFIKPVSAFAVGTPVKYYPNSVDDMFSRPTELLKDVPGFGAEFTVLFAGNIGAAQAVDVIVDTATLLRQHKDIQFVVLGEGSRRDWMLHEIENRQLTNLHLPGRFPMETMPGFMQNASALLVTLADQEIFAATVPSKVQSYLAAGRPILACLNGEGARLVLEAGAGLAVPAGDGKALAQAVLELCGMTPREREEMGEKGRHYYQMHFDHDRLIDQLIEHFRAITIERKR